MRPRIAEWLVEHTGLEWIALAFPNGFLFRALAAIVAIWLGVRLARRLGLEPDVIWGAGIWLFPAALIGGRLAAWWRDPDSFDGILAVLDPISGDNIAYGGILAGMAVAFVYFAWRRVDVWRYADVLTPGIGVAHAIVRLGCFVDGCDYGASTGSSLGVVFPRASPVFASQGASGEIEATASTPLPVHATQLYEAAGAFVLALIAAGWIRRRGSWTGTTFLLYWGLYAIVRFGLEELRGDVERGRIGPVSTSQAISVVLTVALGVLFVWRVRRAKSARSRANTSR